MAYTGTNWSAVNNLQDLLGVANTNAGGWFWTGITIMIYFVLSLSLITFGWEASFLTSAFVCFLISLFLAYIGLASWWLVGGFVGIIVSLIIYIIWSNPYD